jgi:putative transposase
VQSNHLHLLIEARDQATLARGMQGLSVRIAKALNRHWNRHGTVFSDRYHARALRTPREVRNALVYVLQNARKHGWRGTGLDPLSSASRFDGWADDGAAAQAGSGLPPAPVVAARTWLARTGWKRCGRIRTNEVPRRTV